MLSVHDEEPVATEAHRGSAAGESTVQDSAEPELAHPAAVHPPAEGGRAVPGGQKAREAGGQPHTLPTSQSEPLDPAGLVLTGQNRPCKDGGGGLTALLGLRFPAPAEVRDVALALQTASRESALRSQIEISPGSIRLRRTVPPGDVDERLDYDKPSAGSEPIRVWTAKSRRQMTRSYAALDLSPLYDAERLPVAITLTYPADWLTVAPDGAAVQRHFAMFLRRWERAWGQPMVALWKREFQRRGAPHIHIYAGQPAGVAGEVRKVRYQADRAAWEAAGKTGRAPRWRPAAGDGLRIMQWVGHVWADIVGHPDPAQRAAMVTTSTQVSFKEGLRYSDPKRLSIYFAKHGLYRDKEYQNKPPPEWDGKPVGRFWGYTGLSTLIVAARIDGGKDYQAAKRVLRRWSARVRVWDPEVRQYRYVKAVKARRVQRGDRVRTVRRPVGRLGGRSGTLCVNDGPGMGRELARYIALTVAWDQAEAQHWTGADRMARAMRLAELRRAKGQRCGVAGCSQPGRPYMVGARCEGHKP
jgi:hypothetical protein